MHATKRIAAITPHRALVVLRFLLNTDTCSQAKRDGPQTRLNSYVSRSECVEGTDNAHRPCVENVSVDHSRFHITVPQEFLDRSDVLSCNDNTAGSTASVFRKSAISVRPNSRRARPRYRLKNWRTQWA